MNHARNIHWAALPLLFFAVALAAFLYNIDPARARESGIADKVVQSSLAADFSRGVAEGRIDIVEFASNRRCMRGRERKSDTEIAALMQKIGAKGGTKEFCGPNLRGYLFKAENPKGLLLVVHGMQSNAGWFLSGDDLAAQGIEVLAFDRRGSGMSDGLRGHVEVAAEFLTDMTGALEFLRAGRRDVPIHLHANCFGTRIAVPYMQDHMERATAEILREEAKAQNPNISAEELEWIHGFKFASMINTSPATNMSEAAEGILLHDKCMHEYVTGRGDWEAPAAKKCFAKPYDELKIKENGVKEFNAEELACVVAWMERAKAKLPEIDCQAEMIARIKDPAANPPLDEKELTCLDNVAWTIDDEAKKATAGTDGNAGDPCTPEKLKRLRGDIKDPNGVFMARSPLTDEMFTTDPDYLKVVKADTTAIRQISRAFLFAAYNLATRMEEWLKGNSNQGKILATGFDSSVLMVLSRQDVMVYNDAIVHEVFQALPAKAEMLESGAVKDACHACNPRVVGAANVDKTRCVAEQLYASCKYPQDVVECVDPKGEIIGQKSGDRIVSWKDPSKPFQRCAEIRLIQKREPMFPAPEFGMKKLLEIDCEHFMELCKDRSETQKYRKAMIDWLLDPRWPVEWKEKFE